MRMLLAFERSYGTDRRAGGRMRKFDGSSRALGSPGSRRHCPKERVRERERIAEGYVILWYIDIHDADLISLCKQTNGVYGSLFQSSVTL